jgi:hypothetical protein
VPEEPGGPPKRGPGRPSKDPSVKAQELKLTLDPEVHACLAKLASRGGYGGRDKASVARYIIERRIDDLKQAGVLEESLTGETPVH